MAEDLEDLVSPCHLLVCCDSTWLQEGAKVYIGQGRLRELHPRLWEVNIPADERLSSVAF